jgi:subtilase family serine protease
MRLIRTGTVVAIAAVAVAVAAQVSSATGPSVPAYRAFCAAGPVRCQSLLRTDVPIVANATAAHSGLGPADLRAAYRLASAAASRGGNQTVAIVDAYDDPTIEQDMNTYRAYYGIPPCTTQNGCFRKVNQDGEAGAYPIANPDWDPEIALDTEMVSAICPKCHILLVEASSADEANVAATPVTHSDLGAAVDTAVNLGATEVSNSYGSVGPEPDQTFWDHYYDHPGVAITASAGDEDYGTIWPAASPFVTAVGGTELVPDAATKRGFDESVWGSALPGTLPNEAQGTGSGCSLWEPKPDWQHDAGCSGRTVADVSAVADNVAIYDSSLEIGGWGVVAGTSISSPIMASVYALAGNAAKVNYGSYPYGHTSGLFDITDGSNFTPSTACGYLCTAGPGYDGPTGLGTPNGTSAF